jgi:hypothetical protein
LVSHPYRTSSKTEQPQAELLAFERPKIGVLCGPDFAHHSCHESFLANGFILGCHMDVCS